MISVVEAGRELLQRAETGTPFRRGELFTKPDDVLDLSEVIGTGMTFTDTAVPIRDTGKDKDQTVDGVFTLRIAQLDESGETQRLFISSKLVWTPSDGTEYTSTARYILPLDSFDELQQRAKRVEGLRKYVFLWKAVRNLSSIHHQLAVDTERFDLEFTQIPPLPKRDKGGTATWGEFQQELYRALAMGGLRRRKSVAACMLPPATRALVKPQVLPLIANWVRGRSADAVVDVK